VPRTRENPDGRTDLLSGEVNRTHAPARTNKQRCALQPGRLSRRVTTGPNGEVTLYVVRFDQSFIPPRWQQLSGQTWDQSVNSPQLGSCTRLGTTFLGTAPLFSYAQAARPHVAGRGRGVSSLHPVSGPSEWPASPASGTCYYIPGTRPGQLGRTAAAPAESGARAGPQSGEHLHHRSTRRGGTTDETFPRR
jgi:hypothetical protein